MFDRGGAAAVAVLAAVRYAIQAVLAPLLATLADRFDRRRVMIGADLARALLIVGGFVVIAADGPLGAVFGVAWAAAIMSLAFGPARASLLPGLASNPSELTAANVVASTIESIGFIVGPAIAALLLTVTGVEQVYLVNAVSFLWSAAVLLAVPAPKEDGVSFGAADQIKVIGVVMAGFRAIAARRELSLVTALYGLEKIVVGASVVFTVTVALDLLELGDAGVGLLEAMLGMGGLLGGLAALVLASRGRIATDFGVGVVLWAVPLLLIAASPTLAVVLATMLLLGLAHSIVDINAYTLIQRLAPVAVMGRVFGAVEGAIKLGLAMGALLMPLLISTIGLRAGLATSAPSDPATRSVRSPSCATFGEIALLRDVPRTATVRAVDDLVLQGIERSDFLAAVTGHGESTELAETVVERWLALS